MSDQTYNAPGAIKAQEAYCKERGCSDFAPPNGLCWRCRRQIYQVYTLPEHGGHESGISVEKAGSDLVTGCPHCHRSYCD